MTKVTALATALLLAATLGCGKKDKDKSASTKPTETVAPAPVAPAPTPPPVAAAPTYSPEAARALVSGMVKCASDYGCAEFDALVAFGPKAAPELLTVVRDPAAGKDARVLAVTALTKIKAPEAGLPLIEVANAMTDDSMLQSDLYKAAGASGGQPVFDALIAEYVKAIASTDDNRDIPLRGGLRAFPAESIAWVKVNLPTAKDDHSSYADLVTDSAVAADLPTVVELLGATKDVMARNRLAAKAIALGDVAHFDVFIAGLKSKDQYDRSDSANFLADVADKAPADKKAELIDLLQKGKAGDQGAYTASGYDEALKALGATP